MRAPNTTILRFTPNGVAQSGDIHGGDDVEVDYDAKRLPDLLYSPTSAGPTTVVINAHAKFDPLQKDTFENVAEKGADGAVTTRPSIVHVPFGATKLELWFENPRIEEGKVTDEQWDSNFGQNFEFPVLSDKP